MAMSGGGQRGALNSDINVTPLVDVMLVLLIIMILVAPMLQQGVDLKLPGAANSASKPETQGQTVVAIDARRQVYLNAVPVRAGELGQRVSDAISTKADKIVLIRADQDVDYGTVMETMDNLRAAGVEDMGLITDPKARGAGGN